VAATSTDTEGRRLELTHRVGGNDSQLPAGKRPSRPAKRSLHGVVRAAATNRAMHEPHAHYMRATTRHQNRSCCLGGAVVVANAMRRVPIASALQGSQLTGWVVGRSSHRPVTTNHSRLSPPIPPAAPRALRLDEERAPAMGAQFDSQTDSQGGGSEWIGTVLRGRDIAADQREWTPPDCSGRLPLS
jgi:hypothetical protein